MALFNGIPAHKNLSLVECQDLLRYEREPGHWVTLEEGQHVFITDRGELRFSGPKKTREPSLSPKSVRERVNKALSAKTPSDLPEGFEYNPKRFSAGTLASFIESKVHVGEAFFKLTPEERQSLLDHEYGHAVSHRAFRDKENSKKTLEALRPFQKQPGDPTIHSKYNNPSGLSELPEELLADMYATAIYKGGQHNVWEAGSKYDKLQGYVIGLAKEAGLPIPKWAEHVVSDEVKGSGAQEIISGRKPELIGKKKTTQLDHADATDEGSKIKAQKVMASEDEISRAIATRAYYGISFDPEKRGEQVRKDYADTLNSDYSELAKLAVTDEEKDQLATEFARYKEGYKRHLLEYLHAKSRVMSPMITGPSRFPVDSNNKRAYTEHRRLKDLLEFRKKAMHAIRSKLRPEDHGIKTAAPDAGSLLQKKIENLERKQALYKKINDAHAKFLKDPKSLDDSDLSDDAKALIRNYKPQYSWEPHPIAPYQLKNNNAEIRRLKGRIGDVETLKASEYKKEKHGDITLIENPELGRIQIKFPGKPDEKIRSALKSAGFRWAPSEGAWQRHLNNGGRYAAERVLKEIGKENTEDTEKHSMPLTLDQCQELLRYAHHTHHQPRGEGGRWVTLEEGQHVYIKDGKFYPSGPGEKAAEGSTDSKQGQRVVSEKELHAGLPKEIQAERTEAIEVAKSNVREHLTGGELKAPVGKHDNAIHNILDKNQDASDGDIAEQLGISRVPYDPAYRSLHDAVNRIKKERGIEDKEDDVQKRRRLYAEALKPATEVKAGDLIESDVWKKDGTFRVKHVTPGRGEIVAERVNIDTLKGTGEIVRLPATQMTSTRERGFREYGKEPRKYRVISDELLALHPVHGKVDKKAAADLDIREEPHPMFPDRKVFAAYRRDGMPLHIRGSSKEEVEKGIESNYKSREAREKFIKDFKPDSPERKSMPLTIDQCRDLIRYAKEKDESGRWVTLEEGQHVYIEGGKVLPHGPGEKKMGARNATGEDRTKSPYQTLKAGYTRQEWDKLLEDEKFKMAVQERKLGIAEERAKELKGSGKPEIGSKEYALDEVRKIGREHGEALSKADSGVSSRHAMAKLENLRKMHGDIPLAEWNEAFRAASSAVPKVANPGNISAGPWRAKVAEGGKEKAEKPPWHAKREHVFAAMRKLDEMVQGEWQKARDMGPRQGEVAVGGADFDHTLKAVVAEEYLRSLRQGKSPEEALKDAKRAGTEAVDKWNRQGVKGRAAFGGKQTLERWTGAGESEAENVHRRFMGAIKGPEKEPEKEPAFERKTPKKGSPERDAMDEEGKREEKLEDDIQDKIADIRKKRDASKRYSKKWEELDGRISALQSQLESVRERNKEGKKARRNAYLEDLAESGEELHSVAAKAMLAGKEKEGYDKIKRLVHEEAKRQGVTEDVEIIAADIASMHSSYPGYMSITLANAVGNKVRAHKSDETKRKAEEELDSLEMDYMDKKGIARLLDAAKYDPAEVATVMENARERSAIYKEQTAKAKAADRAKRHEVIKERSFTPGESVPDLRSMKEKGLLKTLKASEGRFDFVKTAAETGWATNGRFQVKLPEKEHAFFKSQPESMGKSIKEDQLKSAMDVKTESETAKIVGWRKHDVDEGDVKYLIRSSSGESMTVSAEWLKAIKDRWPDAEMYLPKDTENKPILFKSKGEIVGLLMGFREEAVGEVYKPILSSEEPDKHGQRLSLNECRDLIRYAGEAEQDNGRWVTLKKTGTHLFIGKGGEIDKGPAGLKGKKIGEVDQDKQPEPGGVDPEAARRLAEGGRGGPGAKLDGQTQVQGGPEGKLYDPDPAKRTKIGGMDSTGMRAETQVHKGKTQVQPPAQKPFDPEGWRDIPAPGEFGHSKRPNAVPDAGQGPAKPAEPAQPAASAGNAQAELQKAHGLSDNPQEASAQLQEKTAEAQKKAVRYAGLHKRAQAMYAKAQASGDQKKMAKAQAQMEMYRNSAAREQAKPGILAKVVQWITAKATGQPMPAQGPLTPAEQQTLTEPDPPEEKGEESPFAGWHEQTMADRWKRHREGGYYQHESQPHRYSKDECQEVLARS